NDAGGAEDDRRYRQGPQEVPAVRLRVAPLKRVSLPRPGLILAWVREVGFVRRCALARHPSLPRSNPTNTTPVAFTQASATRRQASSVGYQNGRSDLRPGCNGLPRRQARGGVDNWIGKRRPRLWAQGRGIWCVKRPAAGSANTNTPPSQDS